MRAGQSVSVDAMMSVNFIKGLCKRRILEWTEQRMEMISRRATASRFSGRGMQTFEIIEQVNVENALDMLHMLLCYSRFFLNTKLCSIQCLIKTRGQGKRQAYMELCTMEM